MESESSNYIVNTQATLLNCLSSSNSRLNIIYIFLDRGIFVHIIRRKGLKYLIFATML